MSNTWWEILKAGGEGDNRGQDGWMASSTQWTWVWASSGRQWRTGKPGVLQSMGSRRVRHNWGTEKQQSSRRLKLSVQSWWCYIIVKITTTIFIIVASTYWALSACQGHVLMDFTHIDVLVSYNKFIIKILSLFPFYRWGSWGMGNYVTLLKSHSQWVSRARIQTQALCL